MHKVLDDLRGVGLRRAFRAAELSETFEEVVEAVSMLLQRL